MIRCSVTSRTERCIEEFDELLQGERKCVRADYSIRKVSSAFSRM